MHVIVDGYNVMHALPVGREWPGRTFQDRRAHFLDRLAKYRGGRPHRISVVFDGGRGGDLQGGVENVAGIEVTYSARGIEADHLIERMLDGARMPLDVLVVSSDKRVANYARHRGASVARADELVACLMPFAAAPESAGDRLERTLKGVLPEEDSGRAARPRSKSRLHLW